MKPVLASALQRIMCRPLKGFPLSDRPATGAASIRHVCLHAKRKVVFLEDDLLTICSALIHSLPGAQLLFPTGMHWVAETHSSRCICSIDGSLQNQEYP